MSAVWGGWRARVGEPPTGKEHAVLGQGGRLHRDSGKGFPHFSSDFNASAPEAIWRQRVRSRSFAGIDENVLERVALPSDLEVCGKQGVGA